MNGRERETSTPLPVLLFIVGLAMPPEASLVLGGLRISAYRAVLIAWFVPALMALVSGRAGRRPGADLCFALHAIWSAIAFGAWGGASAALESGGIYIVESLGAWLLARAYVRDAQHLRAIAVTMAKVTLFLLIFTVAESLTGKHLLRDAARAIFGGPPVFDIEKRAGLTRAFGSFDHPILNGMFCASAFGLALVADRDGSGRGFLPRAFGIFIGAVTAVSSAPLAGVFVQAMLMTYERITRVIRGRFLYLCGTFLLVWVLITVCSNRSPMKVFFSYLTFNPSTAYSRLLIWEFGSAEVGRHPVFGIGLGEWQRPDWMHSSSIDNFFLATAVRFGLPSLVFLVLGLALTLRGAMKRDLRPTLARHRLAWSCAVIGLVFGGTTVHFWNALLSLFCFLVGAGSFFETTRDESQRSQRESRSVAPLNPSSQFERRRSRLRASRDLASVRGVARQVLNRRA